MGKLTFKYFYLAAPTACGGTCPPGFTGIKCDQCAEGFTEAPNCDKCANGYFGYPDCKGTFLFS